MADNWLLVPDCLLSGVACQMPAGFISLHRAPAAPISSDSWTGLCDFFFFAKEQML